MVSVPRSLNDEPRGMDDEAHAHPTERDYVRIAIILAIITAIEVVIYYVEAIEGLLVPLLLGLSTIKFVMVVGYFMHLKFDDRRLTLIFLLGMGFALVIYIGTWVLMRSHQITNYLSNMM